MINFGKKMEDSQVDCVENKQNTIETQPTKGITRTHARTSQQIAKIKENTKVHRRKSVFFCCFFLENRDSE